MKFTQIGETMGDETTPYEVTEQKSRTVREFIEEVLKEKPQDWGYISVGKHFNQDGAIGVCEYRYGKLVTEMSANALDVEIKKISACGGWSRMDYTINWSGSNQDESNSTEVYNNEGYRKVKWNNGTPEMKPNEIKDLLVQYSKDFAYKHNLMSFYDIATVFDNYLNQGRRYYTSDGDTRILDWNKDVIRWIDMEHII